MSPSSTFTHNDSRLSRRSRSPYTQQPEVRLHEDSEGNIEGVEYLAGSSGYDTEDGSTCISRRPSVSSASSRNTKHRRRNGESRRNSQASTYRPRASGRRKSYPSKADSAADSVRLCPFPGKRPSAQFTLSSPEISGKDTDDDEIPKLSLTKDSYARPDPSIRKSPLLNRDLLRFVNDAGVRDAAELDPMMFALSMDEESDRKGERRTGHGGKKLDLHGDEPAQDIGAYSLKGQEMTELEPGMDEGQ